MRREKYQSPPPSLLLLCFGVCLIVDPLVPLLSMSLTPKQLKLTKKPLLLYVIINLYLYKYLYI